MYKILAAVAVSALALGSVSGFAADTAKKKDELTQSERAEMRNRAEKLRAERAQSPQTRTSVTQTRAPVAQTRAPVAQARTPVAQATKAKQELTQEERTEMRNRAERLVAERARGVDREKAPGTKEQGARKSRHETSRAQPKA